MTQIFVNLPVKDLERTKKFFGALGFSFNPQFTDEKAACMVVSENIFVMLLVEEFFQTFTRKKVADATQATEVLLAVSRDSRAAVDELVDAAMKNGATKYSEPQDHGWMYQRAFADPDGHQWEILFADINAAPQHPGA